MKNELKISTLSIVCVLCSAFVAPAFAAAPVRSLGGVGTYSSASNAASAKVSGTTGGSAISAVRGGSMRVNNSSSNGVSATTGANGTTSTRVAATPRLSIGKYLSGSATLGNTSVVRPGSSSGGSVGGGKNWEERIQILEQFMGYNPDVPNIPARLGVIEVDIENLKADMSTLTGGVVTDVEYDGGVFTVWMYKDGKETSVTYDLNLDFVSAEDVESVELQLVELETKLNDIVGENFVTDSDLVDYALVSDLDAARARLVAAETEIAELRKTLDSMGDSVGAEQLAGIESRVVALENAKDLNVDDIAALQTDVAALKADVTTTYATKAALQNLENALSGYVTIDSFNTTLSGKANVADVYTKAQVNELVESAGNFNPELYYDKNTIDANFATKADIPTVPVKVSELENDAGYVDAAALNAVKVIADGAASMASLNAEDIAENANVIAGLDGTYATDKDLSDVRQELVDQINTVTGGRALGGLAYKNTVATAEIDDNAVTMDKINTTALNGGMAIVQNVGNKTQLVPIVIIDENGNEI